LRFIVLISLLFVTACTGTRMSGIGPMQCVPYAREVSGIELYGDAYTWWDQAAAHYPRGQKPVRGAVLVLAKTPRLPYGHVAVVERVLSPRMIEVTHVNWGQDYWSRITVQDGMRVKDISPNNDWSRLQFWVPESGKYGRVYTARGFIYRSPTDQIALRNG